MQKYLDTIAFVKMLFFKPKVLIFFLFLHENICYGYSLEVPQQGISDEYPQHAFLWKNTKNIYLIFRDYHVVFRLSPDVSTLLSAQRLLPEGR